MFVRRQRALGKGGDASHSILTAEATKQTEEATPELANNRILIKKASQNVDVVKQGL